MTATEHEVPDYPFAPPDRLHADPEALRLSGAHPVMRVRLPYGGEGWLVTRHADVRTVLADPRFSRAAAVGPDVPRTVAAGLPGTSMLSMDPPEHSRLRRPVAKVFTARRVEDLRPRAQEVLDELVERMIEAGPPADLTAALTWTLPITVMCQLLGVPLDDREHFTAWVDRLLIFSDLAESARAREQLNEYLIGLIAERRAAPAEDLLSALVQLTGEDGGLDDEDLVSIGVSLLSAGHEATANQLGNFVYTLLMHPEVWRRIVADPSLVPGAVEELSRFVSNSATAGFTRIATEDVELGGTTVRAGDAVVCELGVANRDPDVFGEPDVLDIHRGAVPHVTFGHGLHHCLGAQLARMELRIVLETLAVRLPGLRLAEPAEELTWRTDRLIRGLHALPVTW